MWEFYFWVKGVEMGISNFFSHRSKSGRELYERNIWTIRAMVFSWRLQRRTVARIIKIFRL